MVMQLWDGKPSTFKPVWLANLRTFAQSMNDYTSWLNNTMGLDNSLSVSFNGTLPDGFGRDRRIAIQEQLKMLLHYLGDVDDFLNDSALDHYDDQGNRLPFHLAWSFDSPPLTNGKEYYNEIYKKLDAAISTMNSIKQTNDD